MQLGLRAGEDTMKAEVIAVSVSKEKGTRKTNVPEGLLIEGYGFKDDAHAGDWHRQVSLLAMESIDKIRSKGLDVGPGDFAENITTLGIDLVHLPIGTRLRVGHDVLMEVTQIGKECHKRCAIYYQAGDCVMPREGIFAKVLKGGIIKKGDAIVMTDE
jgi:MOSC domain-containing protein YiiM